MPKITFKSCPFCGSDDIRLLPQKYGYSVDCETCCAMKRSMSKLQIQAQAAWNNRPDNRTIVKLREIEFDLECAMPSFRDSAPEEAYAALGKLKDLIEEIKNQ